MSVSSGMARLRAISYSTCIAGAVQGEPQRGVAHSVFSGAANMVFPGGFILSLNAASSPHMPNGLQISAHCLRALSAGIACGQGEQEGSERGAEPGTYPFAALRPGMPVLLGAQRLLIEAIDCSLDLSNCTQWNPHIEQPESLDMHVVRKNMQWLIEYVTEWKQQRDQAYYHSPREGGKGIKEMAQALCGHGHGLTPAGDDMLAGWMAINWLLFGPAPHVLEACQQIMLVARRQTHLLSQCWLGYAAEGNVALPIRALLYALTRDNQQELAHAAQEVLALGATSGYDLIQGILYA